MRRLREGSTNIGCGPTQTEVTQAYVAALPEGRGNITLDAMRKAFHEAREAFETALPGQSVWYVALLLPKPWLQDAETMGPALAELCRWLRELVRDTDLDRAGTNLDVHFRNDPEPSLAVGRNSVWPDRANPTGLQRFTCRTPYRESQLAPGVVLRKVPNNECY